MKIPKFAIIFISALITFVIATYVYAVYSKWRISSLEAKRRIAAKEVDVILDVRTDAERATLGFYPGSVHIQSSDLTRVMPAKYPNKDIRILAYCNTGHRARLATDTLHSLGYNNAVYISSGYTSL